MEKLGQGVFRGKRLGQLQWEGVGREELEDIIEIKYEDFGNRLGGGFRQRGARGSGGNEGGDERGFGGQEKSGVVSGEYFFGMALGGYVEFEGSWEFRLEF